MANGLKKFENREVVSTSIKITKTGDGLSAPMEVEPQEFGEGDVVYVVLKTIVNDINFKPVKPGAKTLDRKHNLVCTEATIVSGELVAEALTAQRLKIEEHAGIQRLQFDQQQSADMESGR